MPAVVSKTREGVNTRKRTAVQQEVVFNNMLSRYASWTSRSAFTSLRSCNNFLYRRTSSTLQQQLAQQTPLYAKKCVGGWLMICSGLAAGTVIVGGLTRLTKSGLSMVDWHLFKELPPMNHEAWQREFEKYKQFPEFKLANHDMSLEEFKKIWWMEYIHRSLGRTIGGVFAVPAAFFWYKGWLVKAMKKRTCVLAALLLGQGLLGWYMVKSGLEEETAKKYSDPRVSHYRLAAHLGTAFLFYSMLFYTGLSHSLTPQLVALTPQVMTLRKLAHSSKGLIFLTALSGAFVAGIDAGRIYNTYPLMGDKLIPGDILAEKPLWKNFLENPTTTQFDHRLLGHLVLASVVMTWVYSRRVQLSPRQRMACNTLIAAAFFQVGLGISTLLFEVPTVLASSHQTGALGLLSAALWLTHDLKVVKYVPK